MQRLEVSGAVRPIYGSLGFKRLRIFQVDVIGTGRTRKLWWMFLVQNLDKFSTWFSYVWLPTVQLWHHSLYHKIYTGFSLKNGRMLNDRNTGLMRYKTVEVAILHSITQNSFLFFFFAQQMSPPNARSRSQRLSVNRTVVGAVARCW